MLHKMVHDARQTDRRRIRSSADIGATSGKDGFYGEPIGLQGVHAEQLGQEVVGGFRLVFFEFTFGFLALSFSDLLLHEAAHVVHPPCGKERQNPHECPVPFVDHTDLGQVQQVRVQCCDHTAVVFTCVEEAEPLA